MMDGNAEFWKKKYEDSEKNLQTLKQLAHKGVADYEQLKKKYDQNYKQYEELKVQLEEAQTQLQSFDYYAKQAVQEYGELENELQLEKDLRNEVANYASQVTKEKKEFQRQSKLLLDKFTDQLTIVELGEITEEQPVEDNGLSTKLQQRVEELNQQVAQLDARSTQAEQERDDALASRTHIQSRLEIEKEKVKRLEISVKQHQRSLNQFQRVSLLAIEEHKELQGKFQLERELKEEVVKQAQKIESERKTVVRQSAAAILEASADEKLRKAFENIEELSLKLGAAEAQLQLKEAELKELGNNSEHVQTIEHLQARLDEATDAIARLEEQVSQRTSWNEKLTRDYAAVEKKLGELQARLAPPPPPPPPPPPTVLRPILKLLRKDPVKDARVKQLGQDKPPEFAKALEELMSRIKRGEPLTGSQRITPGRSRQAIPFNRNYSETQVEDAKQNMASVDERSAPKAKDNSAMVEMQSMLKRMAFKKSYSESETDGAASGDQTQFDGPLAEAFKKVRGSQSVKQQANGEGQDDEVPVFHV